MIRELQRRTAVYFEDQEHTAFDYAITWQENGRTLTSLAQSVTESINGSTDLQPGHIEITRNMIDKYLREIVGDERVQTELPKARKAGSHALVENGLQTLDDGSEDRDMANANKLRLEARERLAATWNREEFSRNAGVQVNISFAQQHINALRLRAHEPTAVAAIAATAEGAVEVEAEEVWGEASKAE